MTHSHQFFARLVALFIVLLGLSGGLLITRANAETSPSVGKKELKTLLATARTPEDHQRLAAYYRDEAQRSRAKAREFSEHAEYLASQPATIESKQGISCQCTSHYRYFAKRYAQEAMDFEALAAQHDQLAQGAVKP